MDLLRYLPLAYLSWCIGKLANLPLPQTLALWSIRIFARMYKIDCSQATKSLDSYRSIGDFFTRDLKAELRPIDDGIVSPVDGTLRGGQDLSAGADITQVKGKVYSVSKLLADDPSVETLQAGQLWNFYLSPSDAHHIHSPVDGKIVKTVHIPGKLWPVNDWALGSIDNLFAVNERVVTFIQTTEGLVAVIMIGATNVGRISLAYSDFETNRLPWRKKTVTVINHDADVAVTRGQKIGTFKMGSSVIVLTQRRLVECLPQNLPTSVQYGESLRRLGTR
jgi:phosphatidylserine decarboxylase